MEKIKAEMHLLPENDKVLAVGNVTIMGFVTVKNVRVMKGKDEPYISMPGEYQNSEWRNTVYAASPEMQEELKKTVFAALKEAVTQNLDIRTVGTEIDENGYVTVYHRTDPESAENIKSSHVMIAKEDGLFFSTIENGQNEGYGDSVIKLSIPVEKLVLDDIFSDEAHLRYPLENGIRRLDISDYLIEEREKTWHKKERGLLITDNKYRQLIML